MAPALAGIIKSSWTPREIEASHRHRGKGAKRLAGGWVADLAALGKAILLCETCTRKWRPGAYGYEARQAVRGHSYVIGDCDGCKLLGPATMFMPEGRKTYG